MSTLPKSKRGLSSFEARLSQGSSLGFAQNLRMLRNPVALLLRNRLKISLPSIHKDPKLFERITRKATSH